MKRAKFLILSIALLVFVGCGSDDSDDVVTTGGQISFNGNSFTLTNAYKEDWGPNDNDSFDVDITLSSQVLTSSDGFDYTDINIAYFDLNTSQQNVLETGTYTFGSTRDVGIMVYGFIGANISTDSDGILTSGEGFDVTGGTVTVAQAGNVYTITFNVTGANNASSSGSFSGTLTDI